MSDCKDCSSETACGHLSGITAPDEHVINTKTVQSASQHHEQIELTEKLIFEILKDDFDGFLRGRKGKERAGVITDNAVALSVWHTELENAQQCLNDRLMALSIADAVASDQGTIAALLEEESAAQRDHNLAVRMSGGTEANIAFRPDVVPSSSHVNPELEPFLEVMTSLGEQSRTVPRSGVATSQASSLRTVHPRVDKCILCLDAVKENPLFHPSCDHTWCNDCVRNLLLRATQDEELYPPRCCGNIVPPSLAMRLLDFSELEAFSRAGIEYTAKTRLYCADPSCSTFIPPWNTKRDRGECPKCHKPTHTVCKALGEPDHECPSDKDLLQMLVLAEEEGWRRCPKCAAMVELNTGCNHMTCRCGKEFCYECGTEWRDCSCPLWEERRLVNIAHRVVNNEVGLNAGEAQRAAALERAVQNLREHINNPCQHHLASQWRTSTKSDDLRCEVCNDTLPYWVHVCTQCQMQACRRCMTTRLR